MSVMRSLEARFTPLLDRPLGRAAQKAAARFAAHEALATLPRSLRLPVLALLLTIGRVQDVQNESGEVVGGAEGH
jgi:hypothetical protein